jgi:hypothetical protein
MSLRKTVKIGLKGANSANFDSVFEVFTQLAGASDGVQSIRFRAARRFRGATLFEQGARDSGERLNSIDAAPCAKSESAPVTTPAKSPQRCGFYHFTVVFHRFPLLAGALDVVQSTRFGPAHRFRSDSS